MAADTILETDVYNHEAGHAAKHNAVNVQVNWLTAQIVALLTALGLKADAGRVSALPAQAATAKTYDQRLNVYGLKPSHLRRTRAKLAAAEAGSIAKVICLGSSIAAGQGLVLSTQSWPNVLRDLLTTGALPNNGTGWVLANSGDSGFDPRITGTAGWTKFVTGGDKTPLIFGTQASGADATFTSDKAGTIAEVKFSNLSSTWVLRVDGGFPAAANVALAGGATYNEATGVVTAAGGSSMAQITVSGLANAVHVIRCTANAGTVYLGAFQVRTTSGLQVSNFGIGGGLASDFIVGVGGQPYGALAIAAAESPALVTVDLMTNENYKSVSAATFKTKLDLIVTTLQAANADVLLIGEIPAGGNTQAGPAMDLTAYRTALYEVAVTRDVPVLDMFDRWGSYAAANANGQMSDVFHPTIAGQRDYARAVRDVIRAA